MNSFELLIQPIAKVATSNPTNFAERLQEARNLPVVKKVDNYKKFLTHLEITAMEQGNHNSIKVAQKVLLNVSSLTLSEKASVTNREFNALLYI